MRTRTVALAVVISLKALALSADYEIRLLPVTVRSAPGAFGTTWTTRAYGMHAGPLTIVRGFDWGEVGPPPIAPMPGEAYEATVYSSDPSDTPGGLVYVDRSAASDVHLTTTVNNGSDGVSLPVIPENEFSNTAHYFIGLTPSFDERLMLRIYSLDLDRPEAAVRIQITAREVDLPVLPPVRLLRDIVVPLSARQQSITFRNNSGELETFRIRPLSAQIAIDPLLEGLGVNGPITITVSPAVDGLRIWSFVSETHNQTQRVQIVLPQ